MKMSNKNFVISALEVSAVLLLSLFAATPAFADVSPAGCTGSGLGINLFTNIAQGHIGDAISYSVVVFNGSGTGPVVCDATGIQASLVTPDGVSHPVTLTRTTLSNGQSDSYLNIVTYTARAQDITPDGTLAATASDTGVIHQNITNSQGGGNQGVNVFVLSSLHVIKAVVNNSGGAATPSSFSLHVKNAGVDVAGSPAVGTSTPGTAYSLIAGAYTVSEDANSLYTQSFSGDCDASGTVTLLGGDAKTCTITNTNIPPATLHVIKLVVNGNGGVATPSAFTLHVINASSGLNVAGSPAVGTSTPGTAYSLVAGGYTVSEDANAAYVRTFTGTGCDSSGNVTLLPGDDKICTVVNTDIPPPPALVVVSTGGGGGNNRIVPLIGVLKVPTPLSLPGGSGSVTYNYSVWNVGGVQALTNITVTDDKCAPVTFLGGDVNGNGKIDPSEIWKYQCTTTLSGTTTNTVTAIGHSDDSSDQTAIATAVAAVAVGSPAAIVPGLPNTGPPPPPLISIVKLPSRLTPFPFGGGDVTYTYAVTNPGIVAMHDVTVTDDTCKTVSRISGDVNGDSMLDPGETWIYTCDMNVTVSTRNIATAEGRANGFTAVAYAFATVLVSVPGLPNTGLPPRNSASDGVILAGIFLVAVASVITRFLRGRKTVHVV